MKDKSRVFHCYTHTRTSRKSESRVSPNAAPPLSTLVVITYLPSVVRLC